MSDGQGRRPLKPGVCSHVCVWRPHEKTDLAADGGYNVYRILIALHFALFGCLVSSSRLQEPLRSMWTRKLICAS